MELKRNLKITVTQRRVVRLLSPPLRAFCPTCARTVDTLSTPEAAAVLGVDTSALDSLLAARQVHTLRTASGNWRICCDSLR